MNVSLPKELEEFVFKEVAAGEYPDANAVVVEALRDGDPGRLIDLDPQLAEDAAIDGLWQLLVLTGVIRGDVFRSEVLSYEAPEKYATGMIVAAFERS